VRSGCYPHSAQTLFFVMNQPLHTPLSPGSLLKDVPGITLIGAQLVQLLQGLMDGMPPMLTMGSDVQHRTSKYHNSVLSVLREPVQLVARVRPAWKPIQHHGRNEKQFYLFSMTNW
jgi:hypothetical protein